MIKVGLTGGIGSGKTYIAKVFQSFGIPVYNSDTEAKKLYLRDDVREQMTEFFGAEVYKKDGQINKIYLANIIFNDKDALNKVNSIIHPLVKKHFDEWIKNQKGAPYIIKEAAILFESGAYKDMHKTIAVIAPPDIRMRRVIKRDGTDEESVFKKMRNQLSDKELIKRTDYFIINDGISAILPQINKIHRELLQIGKNM